MKHPNGSVSVDHFVDRLDNNNPGFRAYMEAGIEARRLVTHLAAHRVANGITVADVARRLHVTTELINEFEQHQTLIDWTFVLRYADAIGVTLRTTIVSAPVVERGPGGGYRTCTSDTSAITVGRTA